MTPTPHPLSLNEAARLTGLSVSTLRRRREDLREHGATQHANGSWSIPVDTLVALGMLDHVTAEDETTRDAAAPDEVADLRVEVERERGLRLAAEREVQAITAHLVTAQNTIRMIEAAPPKVETRVERVEVPKIETRVEHVEVPVTPRWVWPAIAIAALLLLLAALLAGWTLTRDPAPQPTSNGQHSVPTSSSTYPLVPVNTEPSSAPSH